MPLRRAIVVRHVVHRSTFRAVRGFNVANADETKTKTASQWKRYGSDDPIDRERVWDDMSESVQDNWKKLGWDQVNWGKGHPIPDTEFVSWHDLSTTQKEAAIQLGCVHSGQNARLTLYRRSYKQNIWDFEDESEESLFDIKRAMLPPEILMGFAGLLLVFGIVCSAKSHGSVDHHDCESHSADHQQKK